MSYRLRRKSRPQADQEISAGPLRQTSFKGGMNLDRPASELGDDQVALAENVICFDRHIEARPGTKAADTHAQFASVAGTLHSWAVNPGANSTVNQQAVYQYFAHKASNIYGFGDVDQDGIGSALANALHQENYGGTGTTAFNVNSDSTMRPLDNGVVVFNDSKLFYIHPRGPFQINPPNPVFGLPASTSAANTFVRRYLVTLSRIVDAGHAEVADRFTAGGMLVHESGVNGKRGYDGSSQVARVVDYATYHKTTAWASGAGVTFTNAQLKAIFSSTSSVTDDSASGHFTHLSIYATLDLGSTGIDPVSKKGNSGEVFIWLADVRRDAITQAPGTYLDEITDDTLRQRLAAGGYLLKSRGFEPLPSGAVGGVSPGFLFTATRGGSDLRYCQLANPENIGYYFPSQFKRFRDSIMAVQATQDILSIFCVGSTHTCTLTAFSDSISSLQSIFILTHFTPVDETLGVRDWGTLAAVDKGTMVAVCSDASVRLWDTTKWGPDLSYDSVNDEIRKMVPANASNMTTGSVGCFFRGAYHLWYSKNSSDTYLTNHLRLGFGGRAGSGWTKYTDFIKIPFRCGAIVAMEEGNRIYRLLAMSAVTSSPYTTERFYWLETYDTFTGATDGGVQLQRWDVDGSGVDFTSKVRFREMIAAEEADVLLHEETHCYFRPMSESVGYLGTFQVSMVGYKDGSATALDTVLNVPKTGDLHFAKELAGRRIQIELQMAAGRYRLVGVDSHCRSLDKMNYATAGDNSSSESTTSEPQYQAALTSASLKHWLSRRRAITDLVTGLDWTKTGTVSLNATGPDGKTTSALEFITTGQLVKTKVGSTDFAADFAILFGVKNPTTATNFIAVADSGGATLNIQFASATSITIPGGSVTVANVSDGAWHMFAIVRVGSTISVYQNNVLKGTTTQAGARGNGSITLRFGSGGGLLYDFRMYSDDLSVAQHDYWYDSIIDGGDRVAPLI